jgi:excinuclease UvrABC nuclease subunit
MSKKSGIYKIVCTANGKVYVGSAVNLDKRKREHFNALRSNRHHNKHLQRAFNKHEEDYFKFEVVIECDEENLLQEEEEQIKEYDSFNSGFNLVETPTKNMLGYKHTQESLRKMSIARKKLGRCWGSFSKEQIRQMRQKFFDGERVGHLAKHFNTHRKTIRACVYLRSYKDVECDIEGYEEMLRELKEARARGERPRSRGWKQSKEHIEMIKKINSKPKKSIRKLSDEQIREIRQRKGQGETLKQISADFDVNQTTISRICRYLVYADVE